MHVAEPRGPAHQVVGEYRAREPRRVSEELPGRAVGEPSAVFEIADRELDGGMVAVELIDLNDGKVKAGDERVVTPLGPQLRLDRVNKACAADDEPQLTMVPAATGRKGGVGDRGLSAVGVDDRCPC